MGALTRLPHAGNLTDVLRHSSWAANATTPALAKRVRGIGRGAPIDAEHTQRSDLR
jgi:hypothetical protein